SLLFNHKTCRPIASSGWSYVLSPGGGNGANNDGYFDIDFESAAHGYTGLAVSPDFTNQNASNAARLDINASNALVGWCAGGKDDCLNVIGAPGLTVNKQTMLLVLDNSPLNNTAGQAPHAQKTYCDWTWGHGDRIAFSDTHITACSIVYGGAK